MRKHQNEEKSSRQRTLTQQRRPSAAKINKVKKKKLRGHTASPWERTTGTMWLLGPRGRALWKMRAEAQQKGPEKEAEGEDDTEHTECFGEALEKEVERNGKVG